VSVYLPLLLRSIGDFIRDYLYVREGFLYSIRPQTVWYNLDICCISNAQECNNVRGNSSKRVLIKVFRQQWPKRAREKFWDALNCAPFYQRKCITFQSSLKDFASSVCIIDHVDWYSGWLVGWWKSALKNVVPHGIMLWLCVFTPLDFSIVLEG
jgi:hypothetical protein